MLPGARDSEGRLFVTTAAPAATDPYVAGLRLTPIGELYVTGLNQAWSPAQLFANGEQGAWYDPSDLSTLFQDSAGSIPVTADGQPVGLMLDKSGNGNDASQDTSTARPIYRTDGTYSWLEFDGIDDSLATAAVDFTVTDKVSVFAGQLSGVANTDQTLVATGPSNSGTFTINPQLSGGLDRAYFPIFGTSYGRVDAPFSATVKNVTSYLFDLAATTMGFRVNASPVPVSGTTGTGGNFSTQPLLIGIDQASKGMRGNIYSLIVRGSLSGPQEIADTETWVNGKTGAY